MGNKCTQIKLIIKLLAIYDAIINKWSVFKCVSALEKVNVAQADLVACGHCKWT